MLIYCETEVNFAKVIITAQYTHTLTNKEGGVMFLWYASHVCYWLEGVKKEAQITDFLLETLL